MALRRQSWKNGNNAASLPAARKGRESSFKSAVAATVGQKLLSAETPRCEVRMQAVFGKHTG